MQHHGSVVPASKILWRGLKKRCPRCNEGALFRSWYTLEKNCPQCGFAIPDDSSDHIAVMYLTTAVQTAFFAFLVLMIRPPSNPWAARLLLALVALTVMLLDMPNRKGLAIALDYLAIREEEAVSGGVGSPEASAQSGAEARLTADSRSRESTERLE